MKTLHRPAAAAAFLALSAISYAATATIDLAGLSITHNTGVSRDSGTTAVGPSVSYTYQVSGTISGTGAFALVSNVDLATFLETLDPGSSAFLSGTYSNPGGLLPVAEVFSKTFSGTFLGGSVTGSFTFAAGINASGQASFNITNVSFSPNLGGVTFQSGRVTVRDGNGPRPDAILSSGTAAPVGADVYSPAKQKFKSSVKTSKTKLFDYTVENDSTATDAFTFKGPKGKSGFKIRYFDGSVDVTAAVLAGTLTTNPLAPGESTTIRVSVKNVSARAGVTQKIAIKTASTSDPSVSDTASIVAKGK